MTERKSPAAPILAAIAIMLLPLGLYVGGYYGLGEYHESPSTIRLYRARWQCRLFTPLAWAESKVSGRPVRLNWEENSVIYSTDDDT